MDSDMQTFTVRRTRRGIGAIDYDVKDKIIEYECSYDGEKIADIHNELLELIKDSRNKENIKDLLMKIKYQTEVYQEDLEIFCSLLTNCNIEDILRVKSMKCKSSKTKHSEYNALRDVLHYCEKYGLYKIRLYSKKPRKFLTKCVDLFMKISNDGKLEKNNELTFKDYKILNKTVIGYKNLRLGLKKFNYGNFPQSKEKKETNVTSFTSKVLHKKEIVNNFNDSDIIIKSKIYPDDLFAHKLWDDELRKYELKKKLTKQNDNEINSNFIYMNDSPIQDKIFTPTDFKEKWKKVAYNKKRKKDIERSNPKPMFSSRFEKVDSFVLKTIGVDVKTVNDNMRKECNKLKKQQDKKLKKFGEKEYFWFLRDKKEVSDITFDVTDPREIENRNKAKNVFNSWVKNNKKDYIEKNYYEVLNDIDEDIEKEEDETPLSVFVTKYSNVELRTVGDKNPIKRPKIKLDYDKKQQSRINKAKHAKNNCQDYRSSINRSDLILKLNKKLNNKKIIMLDDLMVSLNSKSLASKSFRRDLREWINYVYILNKDFNENSDESDDHNYEDEDDFVPYDSDMFNYDYYN